MGIKCKFFTVLDFGRPSISGPFDPLKCITGLNVECKRECREMYPENPRGAGIGPLHSEHNPSPFT
jgi:hypothetical protein